MEPIRVVSGTGTGPTELAAYDAALVDAGVGGYNLVRLSSVIPAGAQVRVLEAAPDLGPTGGRLSVVEAGVAAPDRVGATLSWARAGDGRGIFYETAATGDGALERAREEAAEGVAAGVALREWSPVERERATATANPGEGSDEFAGAVVVAAYGESEELL